MHFTSIINIIYKNLVSHSLSNVFPVVCFEKLRYFGHTCEPQPLSVFSEIINIILHVMFCKSDLANSANQDVSGILCKVDYFAFEYHSSSAYGKYLKYFICFKLLL